MKKLFIIGFVLAVMSATSHFAQANDEYVGVHITVPLTFDALGFQVVYRARSVEARAGVDSRGIYQAGAGITYDNSPTFAPSFGAAYSSLQERVVPYGGFRKSNESNDWEYGAVTYGGIAETTYLFVGQKNDMGNHSKPGKQESGGGSNATIEQDTGGTGGGSVGDTGGDVGGGNPQGDTNGNPSNAGSNGHGNPHNGGREHGASHREGRGPGEGHGENESVDDSDDDSDD